MRHAQWPERGHLSSHFLANLSIRPHPCSQERGVQSPMRPPPAAPIATDSDHESRSPCTLHTCALAASSLFPPHPILATACLCASPLQASLHHWGRSGEGSLPRGVRVAQVRWAEQARKRGTALRALRDRGGNTHCLVQGAPWRWSQWVESLGQESEREMEGVNVHYAHMSGSALRRNRSVGGVFGVERPAWSGGHAGDEHGEERRGGWRQRSMPRRKRRQTVRYVCAEGNMLSPLDRQA